MAISKNVSLNSVSLSVLYHKGSMLCSYYKLYLPTLGPLLCFQDSLCYVSNHVVPDGGIQWQHQIVVCHLSALSCALFMCQLVSEYRQSLVIAMCFLQRGIQRSGMWHKARVKASLCSRSSKQQKGNVLLLLDIFVPFSHGITLQLIHLIQCTTYQTSDHTCPTALTFKTNHLFNKGKIVMYLIEQNKHIF